jgi:hypothetical protein
MTGGDGLSGKVESIELRMITPSMLFWVKVGDLQFDEAYCRKTSRAWLRRTKSEFSETRLGPLLVNQRANLSLWCYDGKGRAAVVRELFGPDEEVLCHITALDGSSKQQEIAERWPNDPETEMRWEARMFLRANGCIGSRKQGEEERRRIYMPLLPIWDGSRRLRREMERRRDAAGGIGPVVVDRLVPGYAIGDPYYLQWEEDLTAAHSGH